jgi:phage-related minor tail protein
MEEAKLKMVIEGENKADKAIKQAQSQVEVLQKKVKDMSPVFKGMATAGTLAFAGITAIAIKSIQAYGESEKQLAQVDAVIKTLSQETLKTAGGSFDEASKKVKEFGSSIQAMSGVADEEVAIGMSKLLQITKEYTKAEEASKLALDLSIYKQIDYASAVDIVGKVYSGNTSILSRYGIQLKDNATKEEAIAMLMERTKGQAEAYGKTFEGQSAILKQSFGDLQESIGKALLPILNDLLKQLLPVIQAMIKWAEDNPELTKNIILIAGAISGLLIVLGTLGLALPGIIAGFAFLTGPVGAVIVALTALTMAVILIKDNWKGALETMSIATETIVIKIETFFLNLKMKLIEIINEIKAKIQPVIDMDSNISNTVKNIGSGIGGAVSKTFGQAQSFLLGSRESGGYIPQTGPYLLHEGEFVVPKNNNSGMNITFNFNGDVSDIETLQRTIIATLNRNATLKSFAGQ